MGKKKKLEGNNKNRFLYLSIVIGAFVLAFVLLINKQNRDNNLADTFDSNFNVRPQVGKVIVAKDLQAIYPKYYAAYINDNHYSIYVYNYYDTISQYNLEFNRLINKIVDYNEKDKMIRYIASKGYGTYNEVLNNFSSLVDNENLKIY